MLILQLCARFYFCGYVEGAGGDEERGILHTLKTFANVIVLEPTAQKPKV